NIEQTNAEYKLGLAPDVMASLVHDLGDRNGAHLLLSRDQGKTFQTIPGPRVPRAAFDEHMMIERKDGSWQVYVRTQYGIGSSISTDRGRTWSEGTDTGIRHTNARFFIRRLRSGNLLLVRHNWPESLSANQSRRTYLTAQLSADDGATWKGGMGGGLLLDDRQSVSYPDGFQAPDGSITIVYDRERTKAMEILFARFTEADIEAGKCVSKSCALRNPINAAGANNDAGAI
ncbi:MAG: sialidase family protein, partial [Acidobacteriota bacterium]